MTSLCNLFAIFGLFQKKEATPTEVFRYRVVRSKNNDTASSQQHQNHPTTEVARYRIVQSKTTKCETPSDNDTATAQQHQHYPRDFSLVLTEGSVVQFQHPHGAIVNATNEGCLGGGGVDGAISDAGGEKLRQHRLALPILPSRNDKEAGDEDTKRCCTGDAKITGPGRYGSLGVQYVIHAVGPMYFLYRKEEETADELLRAAYRKSLERAKERRLGAVAFSLLSSSIFRGRRSLEAVLRIGVEAICEFGGYEGLEEVHLFGFRKEEIDVLQKILSEIET